MPSLVSAPAPNRHLPSHLAEICDLLARGLLRLRSRDAEDKAREAADRGETPLHYPAHRSGHANRTNRRDA